MTKRVIYRLSMLGAMLVGSGCLIAGAATRQNSPPKAIAPKEMRLSISEGILLINGQRLALPAPLEELTSLFGKPSREFRRANSLRSRRPCRTGGIACRGGWKSSSRPRRMERRGSSILISRQAQRTGKPRIGGGDDE